MSGLPDTGDGIRLERELAQSREAFGILNADWLALRAERNDLNEEVSLQVSLRFDAVAERDAALAQVAALREALECEQGCDLTCGGELPESRLALDDTAAAARAHDAALVRRTLVFLDEHDQLDEGLAGEQDISNTVAAVLDPEADDG